MRIRNLGALLFVAHGSLTVRCNNGWIEQVSLSCSPGIEP